MAGTFACFPADPQLSPRDWQGRRWAHQVPHPSVGARQGAVPCSSGRRYASACFTARVADPQTFHAVHSSYNPCEPYEPSVTPTYLSLGPDQPPRAPFPKPLETQPQPDDHAGTPLRAPDVRLQPGTAHDALSTIHVTPAAGARNRVRKAPAVPDRHPLGCGYQVFRGHARGIGDTGSDGEDQLRLANSRAATFGRSKPLPRSSRAVAIRLARCCELPGAMLRSAPPAPPLGPARTAGCGVVIRSCRCREHLGSRQARGCGAAQVTWATARAVTVVRHIAGPCGRGGGGLAGVRRWRVRSRTRPATAVSTGAPKAASTQA